MVNTVDVVRVTSVGMPEGSKPRKMSIPINPKHLVVGDIIHVRGGDAIPADCSWAGGEEILVRGSTSKPTRSHDTTHDATRDHPTRSLEPHIRTRTCVC